MRRTWGNFALLVLAIVGVLVVVASIGQAAELTAGGIAAIFFGSLVYVLLTAWAVHLGTASLRDEIRDSRDR